MKKLLYLLLLIPFIVYAEDKYLYDVLKSEAESNGLSLLNGSIEDIETFYKFIEYKDDKTVNYYKLFYEIFLIIKK